MAANWFVKPATVRLDLSNGAWIEIKERLSYSEEQRLASGGLEKINVLKMNANSSVGFDLAQYNTMRLMTWLVDWNATDEQGHPAEITADAIGALEPDMAAEIDAAISKHIEAREAAKNAIGTPGTT